MKHKVNLLSVSGGKDSTAMILNAIEREVDFECCFADTGNEHEDCYEYLEYLQDKLGIKIQVAKADFTIVIQGKREYIEKHWIKDLTAGREGSWVKQMGKNIEGLPPKPDWEPEDRTEHHAINGWMWQREVIGLSIEQAEERVELALEILVPTGNPFLDMCIWKGRFPSPKARFCTDELKTIPITQQIVLPIIRSGRKVRSWQGVRADESIRRAAYPMHERIDLGVWVYRPILHLTASEVFGLHYKHGIKPNPLYLKGMSRVGCMPCIMCRKSELSEISRRFPEVIARLKKWEEMVSQAAKQGSSTFFDTRSYADDKYNTHYTTEGIEAAVLWSKTERGGRQFNLFTETEDIPSCSSNYGLCESIQ